MTAPSRGVRFDRRGDMRDPYLELVRLLTEAASLEHTLMISYLYAAFSLKPRYASVRGDVTTRSFLQHDLGGVATETPGERHTMLDVAVEEMQHLSLVNRLLCDLGAAPNLVPHRFPMAGATYPFPLNLEPLSQLTVAKYMWIEADDCELNLDPRCPHDADERALIGDVLRVLQSEHDVPTHLGSVYVRIAELAERVAADPPPWLSPIFPWGKWFEGLAAVRYQGEIAHFEFFRELFTGNAFGAGRAIWDDSGSELYPAVGLRLGTAFAAQPDSIQPDEARRVAWLADLHYWIVLMLLDVAFRGVDRRFRYAAIDSMTQALWWLGIELADNYCCGLPFDWLGPTYAVGCNEADALRIVLRFVDEGENTMRELECDKLLPDRYDRKTLEMLRNSLLS